MKINEFSKLIFFPLKIAYPEKFTYVDDPATNNIDTFTKAYVKIGENLREDINMSCQILQVDSYGWLTNGTFNGVMGLFQKKRIRMTSHAINMRPERLLFSDFCGNIFTPRFDSDAFFKKYMLIYSNFGQRQKKY